MLEFAGIKRTVLALLAPGLALWALGCSSSTEPATTGRIVVASDFSRDDSGTLQAPTPETLVLATDGVDSVIVTRARIALRDIKFKTESDSVDFRTSPLVVELNLSGALQDISAADMPFGTYDRVEFYVHKVRAAEVAQLPAAQQAPFQDFLTGGGQSVIIDGRVYKADGPHDFTFYSALNVNQKIVLSPALEVNATYPVANVTLKVTAGDWFHDSQGGYLDPLDSSDQNDISHNISRSIHVFKDTNRDGNSD